MSSPSPQRPSPLRARATCPSEPPLEAPTLLHTRVHPGTHYRRPRRSRPAPLSLPTGSAGLLLAFFQGPGPPHAYILPPHRRRDAATPAPHVATIERFGESAFRGWAKVLCCAQPPRPGGPPAHKQPLLLSPQPAARDPPWSPPKCQKHRCAPPGASPHGGSPRTGPRPNQRTPGAAPLAAPLFAPAAIGIALEALHPSRARPGPPPAAAALRRRSLAECRRGPLPRHQCAGPPLDGFQPPVTLRRAPPAPRHPPAVPFAPQTPGLASAHLVPAPAGPPLVPRPRLPQIRHTWIWALRSVVKIWIWWSDATGYQVGGGRH
jgi:hypothetical protein